MRLLFVAMATTQDMRVATNAAKAEVFKTVFSEKQSSEQQLSREAKHQAQRKEGAQQDLAYVEKFDVIDHIEFVAAQVIVARPRDTLKFACQVAIDGIRHREAHDSVSIGDVCEEIYEHDARNADVMDTPLPTVAVPSAGPAGPVVLYAAPHRGMVDTIRLALVCGGVPHKCAFVGWERFREFGLRLPALAVDGPITARNVVSEFPAILRYAAEVGGLYPPNPLEAAVADSIVDHLLDLRLDELLFEKDGGQLKPDSDVVFVLDEHLEFSWTQVLIHVYNVKDLRARRGPFLLGTKICHADLVSDRDVFQSARASTCSRGVLTVLR